MLGPVLQPCLQPWLLRKPWMYMAGGFSPVLPLSTSTAIPVRTLLHRPWDWLECSFVMSRGADRPCYCDLVWDCVLLVRVLPASVSPVSWVTLSLPMIESSLLGMKVWWSFPPLVCLPLRLEISWHKMTSKKKVKFQVKHKGRLEWSCLWNPHVPNSWKISVCCYNYCMLHRAL